MRIVRLVAGVLALLLTPLAIAQPAQAATTASYTAWTWNVAGWAINKGSASNGLIDVIGDSIRNRGAKFAALNELCWSQYKAVQSNLRNSGWPQDVENFSRFEEHRSDGCDGEPFGLAIFSKAPLGPAGRYSLAADGSAEVRKLLCATLEDGPRVRFCTTHITTSNAVINGKKINETQLGQVYAHLESFEAAGDAVIVAGDLNAQPHYGRLNGWYAPSLNVANNNLNTGAYRELDDTDTRCLGYGEGSTAGNTEGLCGQSKKLDLIFARENRLVGGYSGDSLGISASCGKACSDHNIVIGTATVRAN